MPNAGNAIRNAVVNVYNPEQKVRLAGMNWKEICALPIAALRAKQEQIDRKIELAEDPQALDPLYRAWWACEFAIREKRSGN